jgi:deazaflavin-dependent oxidoreductase (nitroreductase family)
MTRKEINRRQFTSWHLRLLKFLRKLITDGNVWVLKVSKGKIGNSFLGVPVLLLTTTGRKSGQLRTQPLYYLTEGERVILVASNAGTESDPAWLLNLQADPRVTIAVEYSKSRMNGRVASEREKAQLWPELTSMFPKWQMMEDRSMRSFKVVILEPLEQQARGISA